MVWICGGTHLRTAIGDIYMINVLQQDIIVITSEKIAKDLLDRRSKIYSDRPYLSTREPCVTAYSFVSAFHSRSHVRYGWSFNFAFGPYGDRWRSQRRMFHQAFRAEAALTYRPTQLKKGRQLVSDILSAPNNFYDHIQWSGSASHMCLYTNEEMCSGSLRPSSCRSCTTMRSSPVMTTLWNCLSVETPWQ